MNKVVLLGVASLLFSFCCSPSVPPSGDCIEKAAKLQMTEVKDNLFLNSNKAFADFKVEKCGKTQTIIEASSPIKDFYSAEKLNATDVDVYDGKTFQTSISSLDPLGIVTIDMKLSDDATGETEISERIYAYPTTNNLTGESDILLDIHGNQIMASEVSPLDTENSLTVEKDGRVIMRKPVIDDGTGANTLYPIVKAIRGLVSLDDAKANARKVLNIPPLSLMNPLPYFFYLSRLELAKQHYENNAALPNQPTGFIHRQKDLSKFKFGISEQSFGETASPNIGANGCDVVAAFNMLKDSGADIDFPSLIALYELCGADLLFGHFGVNPVPDYYEAIAMPAASALLSSAYVPVLQPILNLALSTVEPLLFALCSWTPADLIVPGSSITAATAAVAMIRAIINDPVRLVNELLKWYISYSKNETDILKTFYGEKLLEYPVTDFSGFKTKLLYRRQAIVCYWNSAFENGSPNISKGAHYVYLCGQKADLFNQTLFKTINGTDDDRNYRARDVTSVFGSKSREGSERQFIWGYVLNGE